MSSMELSMETFGDDKPAFGICSKKTSQTKEQKEANNLKYDTGPWWRSADGEELAYLVSQRSVNLIENCDLPHPQISRFRVGPYGYSGSFTPPLHLNTCAAVNNKQDSCASKLPNALDRESDPSKAQLLEALVYCQTRAREAESLLNQAYAEKEHIIKLFFREASHLFAYKQWFQLLQLENLYFQNKINEKLESSILCRVDLPSVDRKTRKVQTMNKNPAKGKRNGKQSAWDYVSKFGVAFAIGFSLIGAGLLLGWTVGWFLPLF